MGIRDLFKINKSPFGWKIIVLWRGVWMAGRKAAAGRSRRRSPAAFLAVPDGTMVLARGGTPMVSDSRFRDETKNHWH